MEAGPFGDLAGRLTSRLDGDGPLGVAVSGGGDSIALLHRLAEWGRRPLHVFCVDHGLNADSGAWTRGVADHARGLGADFTALPWVGAKPASGLSAAARSARHALLADAARAAGVRVLCLAHTRDDVAEAAWMRGQGSNVSAPVEWAPSPVWPQGRGVFLFRPLLDQGRDGLRQYLRARGIGWIDDPANANPASLRARARQADKADPPQAAPAALAAGEMAGLLDPRWRRQGLIALRQEVFAALPRAVARKVLSAAAVCAGGGDRLPRGGRLDALMADLDSGRPRTLCGARIWSAGGWIYAGREAGDIGRHGDGRVLVSAGVETMWDGRFAIRLPRDGVIAAAGAMRARLNDDDRTELRGFPVELRGILPVLDEKTLDPALSKARLLGQTTQTGVDCVNWVLPRFMAACGAVDRETRIGLDLAEP